MRDHPVSPEVLDQMHHLVTASLSGELSPADASRLEELICSDLSVCDLYLDLVHEWSMLLDLAGNDAGKVSLANDATKASAYLQDNPLQGAAVSVPMPSLLTSSFQNIIGFFSQEVPFACLIAIVIMSLALGVCSQIYITHYQQYARTFGTPDVVVPDPSPLAPCPSSVARITGMVDVKWGSEGLGIRDWGLEKGTGAEEQGSGVENPKIPKSRNLQSHAPYPKPHAPLSVGDRLELSSGLLQLTYDNGAQVILQGPCTYEINSPAGGFLSLGKLTARIGERGEGGGEREGSRSNAQGSRPANQKSEIINHKLPSPLAPRPSPLFTITTPTAVITDLGTEFGVEVDKDGFCEVHVIDGLVQAEYFAADGKPAGTIELRAGEGQRFSPQLAQLVSIPVDRSKFPPIDIVAPFERWKAYSQKLRNDPDLLAYYTFEKHQKSTSTLPNQSAAGSVLDGRVEGGEWVTGRFPEKLALYFHGPGSGDKVVLPEQQQFNFPGPFSVAVWLKVKRFTTVHQALVNKGDDSWRLQQSSEFTELKFDTNYGPTQEHGTVGQTAVNDGRWHLAVIVYEPTGVEAIKRLYLDARVDAENTTPLPMHHNDEPVLIGSISKFTHREWEGWIDEVAFFTRALSAGEIEEMYKAGNPTGQ